MTKTIIKGKRIRTNNQTLQGVMELWKEIASLQLKQDLYAVYFHYESNYNGDYDLLIGSKTNELPDSVALAECNYLEIPVEGNGIEHVGSTWQSIWSNTELEQQRAYLTDYEKYGEDGSITICLSIK